MKLINEKEKVEFLKERLNMNRHMMNSLSEKQALSDLEKNEKNFFSKSLQFYDKKYPNDFKKYTKAQIKHLAFFIDSMNSFKKFISDEKIEDYMQFDFIKESEWNFLDLKNNITNDYKISHENEKLEMVKEELNFQQFNNNEELIKINSKSIRKPFNKIKMKDYDYLEIRLLFSYVFVPSNHVLKDIYLKKFFWENKISEVEAINNDLNYVDSNGNIKENILKEIEEVEKEYIITKYNLKKVEG